ncbi:MAG: 1-deoxy-D-xylulose-5-phosphate synthase [Anaerovoracaceae bacterium]
MNQPFNLPVEKEQLKSMSVAELELLAVVIREELIDSISKTGGHFASNLGVVELTIALERVFDTPRDKVIWDVGHQTYVHKMLTGRWDEMKNIRKIDGISGFPKRTESPHDLYDAGHSGTSISAALGYAKARDLRGLDHACVAVIGDGSLTAGVAYEALNAAGIRKTPLIVILNDNDMSISRNVGGMARHLQNLRTSSSYLHFKNRLKRGLESAPKLGRGLETLRDAVKYALMPAAVFEELGFKYFGPIDGHDISELIEAMETAKAMNRPVLIHAVTVKGKGYKNAENNPDLYHGTGSFDPAIGLPASSDLPETYTNIFGMTLLQLAEEDDRIVAITAAMTDGTGLREMRKRYAERVVDAGIAEQHAVSFAAGLALNDMRPIVAMYSTFLQRAYDQTLIEVCLQNLPVVFAVDRAGISGSDGETHHGQFDLIYLSSMPNMTVLAPKDGVELKEMLHYALKLGTPCAVRFPKGNACDLSAWGRSEMNGKMEKIVSGSTNAILCVGTMCEAGLAAHVHLKEKNIECAVFNLRCVKPIDEKRLREELSVFDKILTLEDGSISGGVGMRVASILAETGHRIHVKNVGWPDRFIAHGSIEELKKRHGLDTPGITGTAEDFFEKKA